MKTKLQGTKGLQNRTEQLNTQQRSYAEHEANRELPTQKVLNFLRSKLPQQYEMAEIVGVWIWLDFPKSSHRAATNTLWRLGFHWNQRRCVCSTLAGRSRLMHRTPANPAPNMAAALPLPIKILNR